MFTGPLTCMMKCSLSQIGLLMTALLFSSAACAASDGTDNPYDLFDTKKNYVSTSKSTWVPVVNVQAICDREASRRGFGAFGYSVKACTFWEADTCVVYTERAINMHTLGHEMRHCFQGDWHE